MWMPPQWPIAFPITAAVMAAACIAIVWGHETDTSWIAGIGGGVIAGLYVAIAWTLRPLIGPLTALLALAALLALTSAWPAAPDAALLAGVVALLVAASWIFGYHVLFTGGISRPVAREMESIGRDGGRRALVVFHPARSGLQTRLHRTLAETMAGQGQR